MIRSIVAALSTLVFATTGLAGEAENIAVLTNMVDAIERRDLEALDELVAANIARHSAATQADPVTNIIEFKKLLEADFATFPDLSQEIEIVFASGDMVAVRARFTGTQTGPLGPFPPSGRRLELPFMGVLRLADGKIVEMWVEWDNLSALTQLGHFQPETHSPEGEE